MNRSEIFDEADLDAALARFDELSRRHRGWKTRQAKWYERFWTHFAARDWDAMAEILADDYCTDDRRRVVTRHPHGRDAEIANMRAIADVGVKKSRRPSSRPAGSASSCRVRYSGRDQRPEAFNAEVLSIVEIDADERIAALRHRSTSTTSTPPSRNSMPDTSRAKRPPTRTHGRSSRRPTPRSTGTNSSDDAGLGERRSPARDSVRAGRPDPVHPCHVGRRAGHQHPHRGRASAERPRSGRHPYGAWDLARRLRRRVAGDRLLTVEGDLINRMRALRRGRPRRRARAVRRAQPAGTAAGERGNPSGQPSGPCFSRPRLGRHAVMTVRRLVASMTAVGS